MCLLVRVTVVDKNKAVVCCLLATSAIMLSEKKERKRKMWSKKWYLRRNISCDGRLSFIRFGRLSALRWCAIVVSAGKLRKLWDSRSELRSSVCVKDDWKEQIWGLRYCLSKLRSLLSFFCQAWRHTVKSLSLTASVQVVQLKGDRILIWVIYLLIFTTCCITQLTSIYNKCWKWCPFISMHLSTRFTMFLATFLSVLSFILRWYK